MLVRVAVTLPLVASVTGCSYIPWFGRTFTAPQCIVTGSKVTDISTTNLTAVFGLEVHNPNSYGIRIRQVRYRLRIYGTRVAEGTAPSGVTVAAYSNTALNFPVRIRMHELRSAARHASMSEIPYELDAWLALGSPVPKEIYLVSASALRLDLPLELTRAK